MSDMIVLPDLTLREMAGKCLRKSADVANYAIGVQIGTLRSPREEAELRASDDSKPIESILDDILANLLRAEQSLELTLHAVAVPQANEASR